MVKLFIIQAITFVVVLFLLRFHFSRMLNVSINRLNVLHEENLVKESQLTEELKRAKEEKDAEILRGKEEGASIIEKARGEAASLRVKIEDEANIQAEKIISQSRLELDRLKEKMKAEIKYQSFDLAVELISQVFTEGNNEALQGQFLNEIIEEISKLPREKFLVATHTVKATSSFPLKDEQRENLKNILNEKFGAAVVLNESVDNALICGLNLELGGLIIDGTLKNKLRRAVALIKKS
ncbi:MAG: F0F1 ATP synthase subunit delta [Candidatus Omnitrophota bacterium]